MARRKEAGTLKLCILSAALVGGLAMPAQAGDNQIELSATTTMTTDYIFRGISQTLNDPAIQGSFDASYGIFYAGIWASNVDFGAAIDPATGAPTTLADLEIDYYAGIAPTWNNLEFDFAALYYTYPSAFDPGAEFDYLELKAGVGTTIWENLALAFATYYSPDNFAETGENWVFEFGAEYAFQRQLFNFFSPSVSALIGFQEGDDGAGGFDYTYWNAGLTLGFMDNWSVDVRYWDTDAESICGTFCDERVVGTVSASF